MTLLVVKVGGSSLAGAAERIRALAPGNQLVVLHGAGPQITAEMERRGLEVRFVAGRRYTDAATIAVVRESLVELNAELCTNLGSDAVGLIGDEIGLEAGPVAELGLVGEMRDSRPAEVLEAIAAGKIPVVAPIAVGPLNVNGDDAAAAVAVGIGAARVVFLTDVPGVYVNGEVISEIGAGEATAKIAAGEFQGGIVPKLEAAVRAARRGVVAEIGATAVTP